MKSKQIAVLFLALLVILSGCELGMMKSVQIVTDPTVEVSLGQRTGVFSEFLNIDEELANVTDDTEGLDRSAATAGAPISLHLQQDMIDISINDFAGDNLELDAINQTIDEITFEIPQIGSEEIIALAFDPIDLPVTASIPPISLTDIPEAIDFSTVISTPTISAAGFDSLTFATGVLIGDVTISNGLFGLNIQITSAVIKDGSTILATATNTPVTADGTLAFDLSGVELPSEFTMDLGITITDGTPSELFDMDLAFSFSPDTKVSAAKGVIINESLSDSITIPFTNTDLVSATIDTGSIDIDLTYDSSWKNLDTTLDLTLKQGGATLVSDTGIDVTNSPDLDLSGVTIASGDLTLEYVVYVKTTPTLTSDFSVTAGVNEITGSASSSIDSFSSMIVEAEDLDFEQTIVSDVSSDITDFVDIITFKDTANISITLDNQLPPGSDISVTLSSPELEVSGPQSFPTGALTTRTWSVLSTDPHTLDLTSDLDDTDTNGTDDVDFTLTINMPNYDKPTKRLTLNSVNAGEIYTLSGGTGDPSGVVADLSIESVHVMDTTGANAISGEFPESGSDRLDFSMLNDFLPQGTTFPDIIANLNLELDADSLSFTAKVYAEYTDADNNVLYLSLVGSNPDGNGIPQDPEPFTQADTGIPLSGITTLIDLRASEITLFYEVTLSEGDISLNGDTDQRIRASVVADIPLKMRAASNASLELDGEPVIPAATEDIFGRDGSEDDDQTNDYLNMLSTASVNLTFTTPSNLSPKGEDLIGIGFSMTEDTNPAGYGDFELTKELTIVKGDTRPLSLSITPEQIARMIADDAFMPTYDVYLTTGDHLLVEGFDLDIGATMSIESDVNYTIDLGGNEE